MANAAITGIAPPCLHWEYNGQQHQALWHSEAGRSPPQRLVVADDGMAADTAYRLICEGAALLWQGDFFNARHLLQALQRRVDKSQNKPQKTAKTTKTASAWHTAATPEQRAQIFHQQRQAQARRAHILGSLLLPLTAEEHIPLRRAPSVQAACRQAWGLMAASGQAKVLALRELLGIVSAYEWRKKGVAIAALQAPGAAVYDRIHPHYGVFSPVRGEYVDLLAQAPLPALLRTNPGAAVWDIGTGTGVVAAVLAHRGLTGIVGTDTSARALTCAQDNVERLGLAPSVQLQTADLFPSGQAKAALVVCNPPWLPGRASTSLEQAVYDPNSQMLRGFLHGLSQHLLPGAEGWLILSDLAEHLGLRSRAELLQWIAAAGLTVVGRLDTRPRHRKVDNSSDPLHPARAAEVTSLWRLGVLTPSPVSEGMDA